MPVSLKRLLLLITIFLVTACSMPGIVVLPAAAPAKVAAPLKNEPTQPPVFLVAGPDATPTPTPFQPMPPTPVNPPNAKVVIPTVTLAPTSTPNPDLIAQATPAPELESLPDQINILLLGSDKRPWDVGYRTDSIILLTLNPHDGTASLMSFPRDLYVNIPGYGTDRINTAFYRGGFKVLVDTLNQNFGVKPTKYLLVDFKDFKQYIDSIGGLDIDVGVTLTDRYVGKGMITIKKGHQHLNADYLLWYARSRHTSNDFARARRQHEVLIGLFKKMLSVGALSKIPDLYNAYKKSVQTNLTLDDILPLAPLAAQLADTSHIKHYYIDYHQVYDYITPGGAMVLLPKQGAINDLLRQALRWK